MSVRSASHRSKIGNACDEDSDAVISCADAPGIYDIPRPCSQKLDDYILDYFGIGEPRTELRSGTACSTQCTAPQQRSTLAWSVSIDLPDACIRLRGSARRRLRKLT